MLSLILIILGHTAYGTTNTLWKNPRKELGTLPLIIFRSSCCFVVFLFCYFLFDAFQIIPSKSFDKYDVLKTVGICAINYFGLFFYLKSLKHAQVSSSIGFSKMGLIIGVAIGYFVYKESISVYKIGLCVLLFISISLIEKAIKSEKEKISNGLIYTTLSRVFWSTAFLFVPFIEKLGAVLFCAVLEFTVFAMSVLLFIISKQKIHFRKPTSKVQKEMILLVLLGIVGTFSLNFAIIKTNIIVFAFLGLIEPVVGLLISRIYHQERINKLQFIGIGLGLLSATLISLI
jgi:drug/metabolite transporter (DMT)-like permease